MESSVATEAGKPPYGAFRTFWNFVKGLAEHGVPQQLDRSVMGSRGGTARSELYTALRFLGLMDDDKRPTAALHELVADASKERLRELIEARYAPVLSLDVQTATPRQVDDTLQEMGATAGTVPKARTFFLHAAQEAGIEVGRFLAVSPPPVTSPRRRPRTKKNDPEAPPLEPKASLHPAILTLVQSLPTFDPDDASTKPEFSSIERKAWFEYARATFNLIYAVPDGDAGEVG